MAKSSSISVSAGGGGWGSGGGGFIYNSMTLCGWRKQTENWNDGSVSVARHYNGGKAAAAAAMAYALKIGEHLTSMAAWQHVFDTSNR